jgi:riboflavin kinase/FMN adenylyltransferase
MKLVRGLSNLSFQQSASAITIGNFDGVHLGHQYLLTHLKKIAQEKQLKTWLITFEPQPNEYFLQEKAPARLMRLRDKLLMIENNDLDGVLCLRFTEKLAHLSAEAFIKEILVKKLNPHIILVGEDFHFGYQRTGNLALLQKFSQKYGYEVVAMKDFLLQNERVSSTRIRQALNAGDLSAAENYLGHPYRMTGRVAHGDKRGRIIGFPTANIYLHRKVVPLWGVYAVKMFGVADEAIYGVANIGNRPTVDGGGRTLLEVHLFNFSADIYGKQVEVEFVKKLRDEKRFASFDLLKEQIMLDARQAREFFQLRAE